MLKLRIHRLL